MYVLHYNYSCWDEHESYVIAVSEDREKLEAEIERLLVPVREYRQRQDEHRKAQDAYYKKSQKAVRKWLEGNLECVREIRPRMFNGEFYVKDFHTLSNTPYHPSVKQREQEKAIDTIVTTHWQLFVEAGNDADRLKRLAEFINFDVLTNPVLKLQYEEHPYPKIAEGFYAYHDSGFIIEEVKVL